MKMQSWMVHFNEGALLISKSMNIVATFLWYLYDVGTKMLADSGIQM